MEEAEYKQWWPLHRRAALGEPLSAEEQARYEAGLRQLEAEEPPIQSNIDELRQARQQMLKAQAEYQQLQKRYEEMLRCSGATPNLIISGIVPKA